MATQLAERTANPVQVFRQTLSTPQMREQIRMALPNHISVEKFERVALTAVQQTPALLDPQRVDRGSLFGALVKAAQDGLLPDGREGAIVPYKGKAMWQPMVAGIMTKVRRSGEIANWEVAAVYEKDTFQRLLGDDQRIYHEPFEDGDPGQVIGAYSIVTFKDGTKSRDYMPRWRIEKARAQGAASDSLMWTKFYDEGAIKTVVKHHAKRLPMSTDVEALFERDDSIAPARVTELKAEPTAAAPLSRLDAIEHQISEPDPPVEPEVITEQAEEIEAEIVNAGPDNEGETEREPDPRTNDLLGEFDAQGGQQEGADPAAAKCNELIGELKTATSVAAITALWGRNAGHIEAMDEGLLSALVAVKEARLAEIKAGKVEA